MPVDRILVVDDEETIREIVSSMLTHANYKCRQAASGLEAARRLGAAGQRADAVAPVALTRMNREIDIRHVLPAAQDLQQPIAE